MLRNNRIPRVVGATLIWCSAACSSGQNENLVGAGPSPTPQGGGVLPSVALEGAPAGVPVTQSSTGSSSVAAPSIGVDQIVSYPVEMNSVDVYDGEFASVDEMSRASELIIIGDVVSVSSLGRPSVRENETAAEYVEVQVKTSDVLKGEDPGVVSLGWAAFATDADGNRIATRIENGIYPPALGDRMLLFLVPIDPNYQEYLGGSPTHDVVKLDGMLFIEDGLVSAGEPGSPALAELSGLEVEAVAGITDFSLTE